MWHRAAAAAVAVLALAGCSDGGGDDVTSEPDAAEIEGVTGEEVDAEVAAVLGPMLEDRPFRGRATGQMPFIGAMDEVFEQSGEDFLSVSNFGGYESATAVIGDTVHEWDRDTRTWGTSSIDQYDPLMSPATGFFMAMTGLFDLGSPTPVVATGWTEITGDDETVRRFERELDPDAIIGDTSRSADAPAERFAEDAVVERFFRDATSTVTLEIDEAARRILYTVRHDYDLPDALSDCAPLAELDGTTEVQVEFVEVGDDVVITVPDDATMAELFPVPEGWTPSAGPAASLDDLMDDSDDVDMDLSGCPTGDEASGEG